MTYYIVRNTDFGLYPYDKEMKFAVTKDYSREIIKRFKTKEEAQKYIVDTFGIQVRNNASVTSAERKELEELNEKELEEIFNKRIEKPQPNTNPYTCVICGNSFHRSNSAITCSPECSRKRQIETVRKWQNENPEKVKEARRYRRKKKHVAIVAK